MRLALLSDIHANLPALEAVLDDADRQGVNGIIFAGDLIGGPHLVETVKLLRQRDAWAIRGNNELYLLEYPLPSADRWQESQQWGMVRWSYRQLDADALAWISTLPDQLVLELPGASPIRIVHGSLRSPTDFLFPDRGSERREIFRLSGLIRPDREVTPLAEAIDGLAESVLVCGHSHIPWQQEENGHLVLNPGSVGVPLDGQVRAEYALLAWTEGRWQAEQRYVPYDHSGLPIAFKESGLLEEGGAFARAYMMDMERGSNVVVALVNYAYQLAATAGASGRLLPPALWQEAVDTFDWNKAAIH